jgi:anti-sigma regulatory factor (Ser/Thr protein kinase)
VRTERQLHLSANADGARHAALAARDLLTRVDPSLAMACELAVMEACANVVEHAYGNRGGSLRVVLRLGPASFSVAVCDEGAPFDGATVGSERPEISSEGGRGIALLHTCMDRLEWRRVDGENRLLMTRSLQDAA